MLTDDGVRLVKLFFHITPEEQLARFEERLRNPLKRWKLSYEDFRNRKRWDDYARAINEMFEKTSKSHAPWHLIPANDKRHARIEAIELVVKNFSRGVDLSPPTLDDSVLAEAKEHFDLKKSLIDSLAGRTD
jgi:polyphosphate kinase 2 (PPK2 family)